MEDASAPDNAGGRTDYLPLGEVLFQCLRHFVHLDESNAAIHCGEVRYSPLTFRLAEQLASLPTDSNEVEAPYMDPYVGRVLAHVGLYDEDKGR